MNLNEIKGIGKDKEQKLNSLNIKTINDLQEYYPYKYNCYSISKLNTVKDNENCVIKGTIAGEERVSYIKKNLNILTFLTSSDGYTFNVKIYNRFFLKKNLNIGKEIILIGKYNKLKKTFIASDIKFDIENNKIEPVYHLTEGLKNSFLSNIILESLNYELPLEHLPMEYQKKYNFISKSDALNYIHKPKSVEEIKKASVRLKYEELFEYMFKINYLKELNKKAPGIPKNQSITIIDDFMKILPFELTEDQIKSIKEIFNDLKSNYRMNRLVLGDVGSGKTVVAIFAIYMNFLSGYQSALMAPTEILAEQHFSNIKKIFKRIKINIELLTGAMKKKEKDIIYEKLKKGEIDLLIGTHSLISENIIYKNLGLVVVDEQHRFGVNQREILSKKGNSTDVLYLSATPIPRTYALTIYGDLDLSIIKTKPKGRLDVITKLKKEKEIKEVLFMMLEEIKKGHLIYVVSPLIENNNELDLKSVLELAEKMNIAFNNQINIGVLHGKKSKQEKESIMNDFKNGIIKILISTTVIEVGVDIKDSTMIVIFNAERFGLATLHQLRGRVGRNDTQSYCYLVSNYDTERLKVLEESNDGFYISEKDFELRGSGDIFGEKQSGDLAFKIVNLKKDYEILLQTQKDSEEYLVSGKYLTNKIYKNIVDKINFIN